MAGRRTRHRMVGGLQAQGIGASVKHFAANNQEHDRVRVSAEVDERTLREIYLPAFERVVSGAQPWTVMCAYNRVNGTHASENRWLLTEVLREDWGFEGVVVSDWGAVHDRVAALRAGLDLEMPPAQRDQRRRGGGGGAGDGDVLDAAVLDTGVRGWSSWLLAITGADQQTSPDLRRAPRPGSAGRRPARRCCCATRTACCR